MTLATDCDQLQCRSAPCYGLAKCLHHFGWVRSARDTNSEGVDGEEGGGTLDGRTAGLENREQQQQQQQGREEGRRQGSGRRRRSLTFLPPLLPPLRRRHQSVPQLWAQTRRLEQIRGEEEGGGAGQRASNVQRAQGGAGSRQGEAGWMASACACTRPFWLTVQPERDRQLVVVLHPQLRQRLALL